MRLFQSRHNQRSLVRNCEHYLGTMMSEETTTIGEVMAGDVITQPGLYESRGGDIVQITAWRAGWWVSEWNGIRTDYGSDGRQRFDFEGLEPNRWQLLHWVGPLPTSEPQPETTSEQLAEIEGQADTIEVREGRWRTRGGDIRDVTPTPEDDGRGERWPWWDAHSKQTWRADGRAYLAAESVLDLVTYLGPIEPDKTQELPAEYTPPEGWRLLEVGETLTLGDEVVHRLALSDDGPRYPTERVGSTVGANQRYIRRIEQQPRPEPQPQPETPMLQDADQRIRLLKECNARQATLIADLKYERAGALDSREVLARNNRRLTDAAEELRSEVSHVQRLLGESRQRVTALEELVVSLRTINEAAEKAVDAAGKENTALRTQLAVVKEELTTAAAVCQKLQIELDAAQQVPADSPELRQLRSDLAEMTRDRDLCKTAYDRIFADLLTIRETTAADTVEAVIEWLQPFRGCNSPSLALLLIEALPDIIRNITGLNTEDVE